MKINLFKIILILFILVMFLQIIFCGNPSQPDKKNDTPDDPFQLKATIGEGGILLTWNVVSVPNLTSYKVYKKESEELEFIVIKNTTTTTYLDEDIENGHNYTYIVAATDYQGNDIISSDPAGVKINTKPVIVINNNEEYTSIRNVDLTILAFTAVKMRISNSADTTGVSWESYKTQQTWTLEPGEGKKTVFLQVEYQNNSISILSSDDIEPTPMNPSIIINNDDQYTSSRDVSLALSCNGVSLEMKVSEDTTFTGINWEEFTTSKALSLSKGKGKKTVYAHFKNDFEIEETISDNIEPALVSNASIKINDNSQYTSTRDVIVTISADFAAEMQISEDSTFTGSLWETYSTTKNATLSTGDGAKKVYSKFRNDFEIESDIIYDNITLDQTPPVSTLNTLSDTSFTGDLTILGTASDGLSGVKKIEVSVDNGVTWQLCSGTNTWNFTKTSITRGSYKIISNATDNAGNSEAVKTPVTMYSLPISPILTTIITNPSFILPDGSSTSTIKVIPKDYGGNNLGSDLQVSLTTSAGTLIGTVTYNSIDQSYTQQLQSSKTIEISEVTATVNGIEITNKSYVDFTTVVTDIDGNTYNTIKIGNQWWMVENLKVTHYRNGDAIPNVASNTEWSNLSTGAYCTYDNNESNAVVYGRLYNWYAVDDSRNIAPAGWHVPTDDEWKELEMYLGMSQSEADDSQWRGTNEGGKLKEAGYAHWNSPNTGATNESGFTALPGGYRDFFNGYYSNMGLNATFWSSTEGGINDAWFRRLHCTHSEVDRFSFSKRHGFSVRCVMDN